MSQRRSRTSQAGKIKFLQYSGSHNPSTPGKSMSKKWNVPMLSQRIDTSLKNRNLPENGFKIIFWIFARNRKVLLKNCGKLTKFYKNATFPREVFSWSSKTTCLESSISVFILPDKFIATRLMWRTKKRKQWKGANSSFWLTLDTKSTKFGETLEMREGLQN